VPHAFPILFSFYYEPNFAEQQNEFTSCDSLYIGRMSVFTFIANNNNNNNNNNNSNVCKALSANP